MEDKHREEEQAGGNTGKCKKTRKLKHEKRGEDEQSLTSNPGMRESKKEA